MIEIIPNWHPIFVHFSIGLLGISAFLFLIGTITKQEILLKTAHVNLWIGAGLTIGTALLGLQAAGSVAHDDQTHLHMLDHRNWALPTAGAFVLLALYSALSYRKKVQVHLIFVAAMLLAAASLAVTGFKGGELVYRYGTGVMSLPQTDAHDHSAHDHGSNEMPHHEEESSDDHHDHGDHEH